MPSIAEDLRKRNLFFFSTIIYQSWLAPFMVLMNTLSGINISSTHMIFTLIWLGSLLRIWWVYTPQSPQKKCLAIFLFHWYSMMFFSPDKREKFSFGIDFIVIDFFRHKEQSHLYRSSNMISVWNLNLTRPQWQQPKNSFIYMWPACPPSTSIEVPLI